MVGTEWEGVLSRLPDGSVRRGGQRDAAATLVAADLLLAAAKKAADVLTAVHLAAAQRSAAVDLSAQQRLAALEVAMKDQAAQADAAEVLSAAQADAAEVLFAAQADAAEVLFAAQADAAEVLFAAARDAAERLATAQEEAFEDLAAAEEQFRFFMDWSGVAGCTVSKEGRFLRVNRAFCELLGSSEDELLGVTMLDVTHPDDVDILVALVSDLLAGSRSSFRTLSRYLASDGRVIWGDLSVAAVLNSDGTVAFQIAQILDVTERIDHEAALAAMATHDSLTGLANRTAMLDEVTRALSAQSRSGRSTAVLVMDLDHFKNVNDSLGHAAGDELLKAAAGRIASLMRGGDLAARPGGDEFGLVMRELDEPTDAVRAAWRLVQAFRDPFVVAGIEFYATASIGVTIAGDTVAAGQDVTAGDLLREADTAMYAAKAAGRDRVSVYNEDLRDAVASRLAVEGDLRHALERGQLAVWYQPEVDLTSGTVVAVEALLRWHHPDGTVWTADRFIDVAEDTGLIRGIGDWVLRQACAQAATWAAARPDRTVIVRVNAAAVQLAEDGLLDTVDDALAASGLDPTRLCIEITETTLLRETTNARANLEGLHNRRITLALDDFGTGYASLSYLSRYPIDVIKIDRTFITDTTARDHDHRLVAGIIALATTLGITVTAEGVEQPEQADHLRQMGCPTAQGFLYSQALPADQITPLLDHVYPHS